MIPPSGPDPLTPALSPGSGGRGEGEGEFTSIYSPLDKFSGRSMGRFSK